MDLPPTNDPKPWLHENGVRYASLLDAPPGALFWIPRPEYATKKENDHA